jgi:hypothetical protein
MLCCSHTRLDFAWSARQQALSRSRHADTLIIGSFALYSYLHANKATISSSLSSALDTWTPGDVDVFFLNASDVVPRVKQFKAIFESTFPDYVVNATQFTAPDPQAMATFEKITNMRIAQAFLLRITSKLEPGVHLLSLEFIAVESTQTGIISPTDVLNLSDINVISFGKLLTPTSSVDAFKNQADFMKAVSTGEARHDGDPFAGALSKTQQDAHQIARMYKYAKYGFSFHTFPKPDPKPNRTHCERKGESRTNSKIKRKHGFGAGLAPSQRVIKTHSCYTPSSQYQSRFALSPRGKRPWRLGKCPNSSCRLRSGNQHFCVSSRNAMLS